jgi:hypothetical protein
MGGADLCLSAQQAEGVREGAGETLRGEQAAGRLGNRAIRQPGSHESNGRMVNLSIGQPIRKVQVPRSSDLTN